MPSQTLRLSFIAFTLLVACGEKPAEPAAPAAPEPPPPAAPTAPAVPTAAPPSMELPAIPEGASVSFIEPTDGAKLTGPLVDGKVKVTVKMGAEKIAVKPAGQIEAGSGHHHLLIDTDLAAKGEVVGKDEQHIHYGQGQTEAEIQLAPGDHALKLQFADGIHRAYGPTLTAVINVNVAEEKAAAAEPAKTKPAAKAKK